MAGRGINDELSGMSLEELWRLFPIILKAHDPRYKEWYETQRRIILDILRHEDVARINHIGSSAVAGLISKPTVDILLEVGGCSRPARITEILIQSGWTVMARRSDPFRLSLNKGYTPKGFAEKVYHLHIVYLGDWDELYFRDYLCEHPEAAQEYGRLKLNLLEEFEHDRDGYTDAKSAFVSRYTAAAKREFEGRYRPSVS